MYDDHNFPSVNVRYFVSWPDEAFSRFTTKYWYTNNFVAWFIKVTLFVIIYNRKICLYFLKVFIKWGLNISAVKWPDEQWPYESDIQVVHVYTCRL